MASRIFIPPTTRPGTLLADQRDVRGAPLSCPVARHGTKGLGSRGVYLVRIGLQYSCGYDPLWRDKTAQLSLARGLAKFVAGSGVTVNSVLPGPTMSDGFAAMMKDEIERTGKSLEQLAKEFVMANRPSSVIQRAATVEEVANMVIYVCSMQASATSGAALRVDGGVVDDIV